MFTILKKQFNKLKKQNQQKGIALVIAITVMTLLLSISFSISNIVLRQIKITNINNASKPAFFVADSAIECAFYYDTANILDADGVTNINADFGTAIFGTSTKDVAESHIKCGNTAPLNLNKIETVLPTDNTPAVITTFDVNYDTMCAKVEVTRTEVGTKITARGYNTGVNAAGDACDLSDIDHRRLVERGLTITY